MFMVLGAAVLWGTTGTARALAPGDASPLAVGAVRIAIGGLALVALALARGTLARPAWPFAATLVAAAGVAAYQLAFFAGVARAGVAAGTIVAIGSAPVFAGLLGAALLGERPAGRWYAATALAVAGVALLGLPRGGLAVDALGLVLPLAAGAAYAVYATASKALLASHDGVAVAAAAFGGGALLLVPILVTSDLAWVATPTGAAVALELGLLATAAAYVLFTAGLARLPVSYAATLSLAEPVTAAALGTLVLREAVTPAGAIGALAVASALALLAVRPRS